MSKAIQPSNDSGTGVRRSVTVSQARSTAGVLRPFAAPASAPKREPAPELLSRLLVRNGKGLVVVRLEEVDWIEAEGNYVRLHGDASGHRYRRTLDALESRLDPRHFVRTHRSAIVNVDRVRELHPTGSGAYDVVLGDGTRLPLSRGYKRRVFAVLGKE